MDEPNYKPNSYKSKQERAQAEKKEIKKVVKGPVKTRKKSSFHKLSDVFISEDANNVKSYVFMDVLVPTIKKAIVDIVSDGTNMIFFGEKDRRKSGSSTSYVSYGSYSDRDRRGSNDEIRSRTGYSYDDIVIPTRGEAEEVLLQMEDLIDTYDVVSVADLYDLVGKESRYTDNHYGWTNIRNAEPIRVRDGYILKLPKAMPIK